ncbi:MAG: alpha/beta hydrolase [Comamonadaceae bacterium]|nr:MAG: alpha/beta hydrolase [Comamonadaceae bacterium]
MHADVLPSLPPSPALLLTEPLRAAADLGLLAPAAPWLLTAPRGDGHPVLVLPGLFGDDAYTAPLRAYLRTQGFDPQPWGQGTNWGRWAALEHVVAPLVERLHARTGRKVSVVGASMGGLYARAVARLLPHKVRCVVTLASAVRKPGYANHVWPVYQGVTADDGDSLYVPPVDGVPSTSAYSRADGLSNWRPCLQPDGPLAENVELVTSHLGMILHPSAFYLVADRLAQPEGNWQPFQPPTAARMFYPATA